MHTDVYTETILRNQAHTSSRPLVPGLDAHRQNTRIYNQKLKSHEIFPKIEHQNSTASTKEYVRTYVRM